MPLSPDPWSSFAVRFFWFRLDALIAVIGYLFGSIPFGLLVAKSRGVDIRQHGSGNIGATNVMRTLGKGAGYTVFACDAFKGIFAVLVAKYIASRHVLALPLAGSNVRIRDISGVEHVIHNIHYYSLPISVAAITAAVACIIGHNFPIWLGFKGGKGMATSAGVLIAMIPETAMVCLALWALIFLATRYVSLASICAAIALPPVTVIFLVLGVIHGWPYFYFTLAAGLLAVIRHKSNIVRLMNGTENRFVKKPKENQ